MSGSGELVEPVRLTLVKKDTETLLFDKDYGYVSQQFDSGVIYLPSLTGSVTPYLVTLYVGNTVYAIPYMQKTQRIDYNGGCSYGVRLKDLDGRLSSDWTMGTMLDLNQLRLTGVQYVNLCAGNQYIIGQALIALQGDQLVVQPRFLPQAEIEVHGLSVFVVTDCAGLTENPASGAYPAYAAGESIPVGESSSALLYMPMTVSFNPAGLSSFYYNINDPWLQDQTALWNANQNHWEPWSYSGGSYNPTEYVPMESLYPEVEWLPEEEVTEEETVPEESVDVPAEEEWLPEEETMPEESVDAPAEEEGLPEEEVVPEESVDVPLEEAGQPEE